MKRTGDGKKKKNDLVKEKVMQDKSAPNHRVESEINGSDKLNLTHGQSKQEKLINLLKQPDGTTIEEMAKATGWQHHSVRGVISGVLRKRLGLSVVSMVNEERGRIYRIGA